MARARRSATGRKDQIDRGVELRPPPSGGTGGIHRGRGGGKDIRRAVRAAPLAGPEGDSGLASETGYHRGGILAAGPRDADERAGAADFGEEAWQDPSTDHDPVGTTAGLSVRLSVEDLLTRAGLCSFAEIGHAGADQGERACV